jgi:hypothetical protein
MISKSPKKKDRYIKNILCWKVKRCFDIFDNLYVDKKLSRVLMSNRSSYFLSDLW